MAGYKEKYADQIQEQFYKLEDRICADIIRRIKKTGEITSTADWQINKLTELGYSSAEIEDMIRETLRLTYPDVFEMYDKVIDWEYVRNRKLYEQINAEYIPFEDNAQLQQLLQAAKDQTQEQLLNLTQSLGIVQQIGGQFTLLPLTQFYQQTLDAAVFDIASGAFDYNSVLKRTVNTLSRSGIRSIDYASGWSNRIAVAARRAVLTGLSQMTAKINEYNAEKLGTEFFEIDRHDGARPTHRPWQGKVWSKEQLVTVCGLGTVTGLNGANCYHVYFPFIPGVSERNYTDSELRRLDALEDQKKRFKDKEYNAYEARQKQRQMETAMRAQRAKVRGLERGGADPMDVTIAKARYQGQLAEYKRFSDAMGLKTQMNRVYIDGLGRIAPGKAFTLTRERDIIKMSRDKLKPGAYPVTQKQIDDLLSGELSNLRFRAHPQYNARIRTPGKTTFLVYSWGEVKGVKKIEIGKQYRDTEESLIDTILHEELEARLTLRFGAAQILQWGDEEVHRRIDSIIKRYFRMRGWDYGLV